MTIASFGLVKTYHENGHRVFAGVIKALNVEHKTMVNEYVDRLQFINLNIASLESIDDAKEELMAKMSHIDILINKQESLVKQICLFLMI